MADTRRVHDRAILDALEAILPEPFEGQVWRITRQQREALRGSNANGRWSMPGGPDVLYTSLKREGALAEIGYRLSLEPIWPSRLRHEIHLIDVQIEKALRFADVTKLAPLGVDVAKYESFDYDATQAIAAAANFLELDGLIVPSARAECSNLVIFLDRAPLHLEVKRTELVDWDGWRRSQERSPKR
jgi:hypothetical protein